jgi:hypothetical protein
VTINGRQVAVLNQVNNTVASVSIISKADRGNLQPEKLLDIRNACCKSIPGCRFSPLPTVLDQKQLTQVVSHDQCINRFREHLANYTVDDVFTIVRPDDVTNTSSISDDVADLFTDYATIDISTVALSCEWYRRWTHPNAGYSLDQDWSYAALKANIDTELMTALQQQYDKFPEIQRGGPLLFALLMKSILHTNDSTVKVLTDQIKKFTLKSQPGEDVDRATATLRAVTNHIYHAKDKALPESHVDIILDVLQTSSTPAFNEHFRQAKLTREMDSATKLVVSLSATGVAPANPILSSPTALEDVETLLRLASVLYQTHIRNGTWNAKSGSPSKPSILSTGTLAKCFNCGKPGCKPKTCSQPLDQTRIARNRELYKTAKAQSKTTDSSDSLNKPVTAPGTSKWRAPKDGEPHTRMISPRDGLPAVQYKWSADRKKWDKVRSGNAPRANKAGTSEAPTSTPTPASTPESSDLRALIADISKSIADQAKELQSIKEQL